MKTHHLLAGLLTGISALALSTAAHAQAATTQAANEQINAAPVANAQGGTVTPADGVAADTRPVTEAQAAPRADEIVVTGSRVIQNGNNSPTPVTVVSTAQLLQTTPSNIQDGLQTLPVFSGGRNATTNPGNSSQNNAAHALNLRNIGITRTLILYDGHRVAPTSPLGEVDADFLPSMLLQRVDVVTGGASAVYGSDAVSGVVNFITDRKYNGVRADIQKGISQRGDAPEFRIGVAAGHQFGDRLHIEGSFEHYYSPGIDSRLERDFGRRVLTVQGQGNGSVVPFNLVENTRLSQSSFDGVIRTGFLSGATTATGTGNGMVFKQNGVLSPFIHGASTGVTGIESGGDGAYYRTSSLLSLYRSDQAFGRIDYDVTDDVHFYAEAVGNWTHNRNNHQLNEFRNTNISVCNGFLTAAQRTTAGCVAGTAGTQTQTFVFSKMLTQVPTLQPETFAKGYMGVAGLEGNLGDKFKWDVGYTHTENRQFTRNNANINQQRSLSALDAVDQGLYTTGVANGNIVCRVTLSNPGLYPGCVALNVFGPTSESQAAIDYIVAVTSYRAVTKQDDFNASIAGSFFDTWAGPVQMALSGEYRKLSYKLDSDALPTPANCTGIRFNCTAGTLQFVSNVLANRSRVSQTVKEIAGEVNIPLLKDVPFFQEVNLNGAGRYTHYDTSGSVKTWKVGIDWHVDDQVTFRATRSRDIRAPNLNELFAPTLINPAGANDTHTGITAQANFDSLSNPNLKPEVAQTTTAGVVLKPNFIPRFSLAIDYYRIKIGNAISIIQGNNATIQQICENSGGTSPYCDLIIRPLPFSNRTPANYPTDFLQIPQNAQAIFTRGIDIEANYSVPVAGGNLAARVLASYQPKLTTVQFAGAPILNPGRDQCAADLARHRIREICDRQFLDRHSGAVARQGLLQCGS